MQVWRWTILLQPNLARAISLHTFGSYAIHAAGMVFDPFSQDPPNLLVFPKWTP